MSFPPHICYIDDKIVFKIVLAILSTLKFHITFEIGFSISAKNVIGILIRIALYL